MKKIVAFVSPFIAKESSQNFALRENKAEIVKNDRLSISSQVEGTVKFEVVLSDDQMQRVVDTLLQPDERVVVKDLLISELLRSEVENLPGETPSLLNRILEDVERELLGQAFDKCNRVKTKTATYLGIDRNTLHKKLLKYSLIETEND